MTITYEVGNGLYVNVTNRCTNACEFCVRQTADGTYGELWLDTEPTKEQILEDILSRDLTAYNELVFCGYGEPTVRLHDILWVCEQIKAASPISIRINTNGHANLINGRNVCPELAGRIHTLSISLNATNAADYVALCHPIQGEAAYQAMLDFAKEAAGYVTEVILTIVDKDKTVDEIEQCKAIAADLGVTLRIRSFIDS